METNMIQYILSGIEILELGTAIFLAVRIFKKLNDAVALLGGIYRKNEERVVGAVETSFEDGVSTLQSQCGEDEEVRMVVRTSDPASKHLLIAKKHKV